VTGGARDQSLLSAHMVVKRVASRSLSLLSVLMVIALLASIGCTRRHVVRRAQPQGSCDGVCAHYLRCKKTKGDETRSACVRECLATYSTDGVQDAETLGHLENLDCEAILGFVEGTTGRAPGERVGSPAQANESR